MMISRRKMNAAITLGVALAFSCPILIRCANPTSQSPDTSPDLWRKSYTIDSNSVLITALCRTPANGIYIAGNIYLADGNVDLFVLKTDADGNQQWLKKFTWMGTDTIADICATADSGFALTGIARRFSILRGSKQGDSLWYNEYGWQFGHGKSIISTIDGSLALAGINGTGFSSVMALVKADLSGNQVFIKGITSNALGTEVLQLADGSYMTFGAVDSNTYDPTVTPYITVSKLSSDGTIQWQKRFYQSARHTNVVSAVQRTTDGFVIAVDTVTNTAAGFVMAISGAGDSLWSIPAASGPVFSMSSPNGGTCFILGTGPCIEERSLADGSVQKQKTLGTEDALAHIGLFAQDGYIIAGEDAAAGKITVAKLRRL
jgi:hypothetical protein